MRNTQSGFSLIEVMAAVAAVGILSAVVIPSFLSSKPKAQTADAQAELAKIEASAKNYYLTEGKFPGSTVMALPGPAGAACSNTGKKFPVSTTWSSDPVWSKLDFHVDQASGWTYSFETTGETTAVVTAIGDPDCDGVMTTIRVDLTAEVAMDDSGEEDDSTGQVAHNWAPNPATIAGAPSGSSIPSSPTYTGNGLNTLTGNGAAAGTSSTPTSIASTTTTSTGDSTVTTASNTVTSTTTVSGACNWGNGNGMGQGCLNGVANGDTNNTNNDKGHSNVTTTTSTTTTTTTAGTTTSSTTTSTSTGTVAGGTVNTSNGNGNGNGKK